MSESSIIYGVPLLDKIYTLKAEPLDATLQGSALIQFADQELAKLASGKDEKLYYSNPAAGYVPPTGEATQERAKLRIARASLIKEQQNANLKNRKKRVNLDSKTRQKDAFQTAISKRYQSLMTNRGGSASEANCLCKAIDSVQHYHSTIESHNQQQQNHREPAGAGMLVMKSQNHTISKLEHGFIISNNPNKALVNFEIDECNQGNKIKSKIPRSRKKKKQIEKEKNKEKQERKNDILIQNVKEDNKKNQNKNSMKNSMTASFKNFCNSKIPKRPKRKKKSQSRENKRLMREINFNLSKINDFVPMELDMGFAVGLQPKSIYSNDFVPPVGSVGILDKMNDLSQKNIFVSINVNRALSGTEATTRRDQSRSAVASRHYGVHEHTSSYPSVFQ